MHRLNIDGKHFIVIGAGHAFAEGIDSAAQVIEKEKPDTVCIGLCPMRFKALKQITSWRETDIVRVFREKQVSLLLSQMLLTSIKKIMVQRLNIDYDDDMLKAIAAAEANKAKIVFAGREIRISLLRIWRHIPFVYKMKLLPEMFFSLFIKENIKEEAYEKLRNQDSLEVSMRAITEKMPEVMDAYRHERDRYLAGVIGKAPGCKIVAVIEPGTVKGVLNYLGKDIDFKPLLEIPPANFRGVIAGWIFLLFVIAFFSAGFLLSGAQAGSGMILGWSAVTASFSGLGALLLMGHPVTIMASVFAAPVTTLHPMVAAGWIAGIAEFTVRKPRVGDFLDLADDIISIRGFFINRITRVLLLIAIVNLTTSIGTFVAIPFIMRFF